MYAASASMIGYQENSMGDLSLWTRLKYENIVSHPGIPYETSNDIQHYMD